MLARSENPPCDKKKKQQHQNDFCKESNVFLPRSKPLPFHKPFYSKGNSSIYLRQENGTLFAYLQKGCFISFFVFHLNDPLKYIN